MVAMYGHRAIVQGTWSSTTFKPFNLTNVSGVPCTGGHLHPLNKDPSA